jgi:hypothetical protein
MSRGNIEYEMKSGLGVELPATDGYTAILNAVTASGSRIVLCTFNNTPDGAPCTDAATFAPGAIGIDILNGKVYVNTTTTDASAASWSIIGSVNS